jgi:hypothetical protein
MVAQLVKDRLGYKYHWALADYLQRSARHLASRTDLEQAHALGVAAVDLALAGQKRRDGDHRPRSPMRRTAGRLAMRRSRMSPTSSARCRPSSSPPDGFHITDACRAYLQPLIEGRRSAAVPQRTAGLCAVAERHRGQKAGSVQDLISCCSSREGE